MERSKHFWIESLFIKYQRVWHNFVSFSEYINPQKLMLIQFLCGLYAANAVCMIMS